jgi:hypothetical protein
LDALSGYESAPCDLINNEGYRSQGPKGGDPTHRSTLPDVPVAQSAETEQADQDDHHRPIEHEAQEMGTPIWGPDGVALPTAILDFIREDICSRNRQACRRVKRSDRFPCTLGCGALLTSNEDRRRHEAAVFPEAYWICYECMRVPSLPRPLKGQFFYRLDKMRDHSNQKHEGQLDLEYCKVSGLSTESPKQCGLCHHRYLSRRDRRIHAVRSHIIAKAGVTISAYSRSWEAIVQEDQANQSGAAGTGEYSQTNSLDGSTICSHEAVGPDVCPEARMQASDSSTQPAVPTEIDRSSQSRLGIPIANQVLHLENPGEFPVVSFQYLQAHPERHSQSPATQPIALNWLVKINNKGGTATVYKVNVAVNMSTSRCSTPLAYAVKQYLHSQSARFEREFEAYRLLAQLNEEKDVFAKCFGTFQYIDSQGALTHNLLLELGESDLWDFWMNKSPPSTKRETALICSVFSNLWEQLNKLHQAPQTASVWNMRGHSFVHGDLKPENILRFRNDSAYGVWKIFDWGEAKLHHGTSTVVRGQKSRARYGTRRYG